MKKALLLIAFLVFAVAACLVSCTLVDRVMPSAEAETVTLPDDGVVGENLLYNSDFSTSIFSRPANMQSVSTDGWYEWYVTNVSYSDGIHYSTTNSYTGIDYFITFSHIGSYTFTLNLSNTTPLVFGIRQFNGTSWVASGFNNAGAYNTPRVVSRSFTISDISMPTIIYLWCGTTVGDFYIKWAKLEQGSNFTGYVPNYEEIEERTEDTINNAMNGWTRFYGFRDYLSDNSNLSDITSSNSGEISYVSSQGTRLTGVAGSSFLINPTFASLGNSNTEYTFSLGYIGSFNRGDVTISYTYKYYIPQSISPPSTVVPAHYEDRTVTFDLIPSEVYINTYWGASDPCPITIVLNRQVDFFLQALKYESGDIFTRFPSGSLTDQSSFDNGYATGYGVGLSEGYDRGYEQGDLDGTTEGTQRGYELGYSTGFAEALDSYQHGTWWDMLGALINVPITFIMSLVSFEIFGFNFANIFRTIVLLSILVFLLRKFL